MSSALDAALVSLRSSVSGRVVTSADADFDEVRTGYNLGGVHRPDAVVLVAGADDVQAAVRVAVEYDLPLAVQGTGHGASTLLDGGLLIVTSALDEVTLDPAAGTVRVGAGVRWGAVAEVVAGHGFAPPMGSSPTVGVTGYLLGGGLSLFGRTTGWAADRLVRIELVTLDGELRSVDATSDADLFWALRGGGGNFGIVTAVEVRLVPDGRLLGGFLLFDVADTERVLRSWLSWTADLPDAMSTSIAFMPFPDLPVVPEPFRGRRFVAIRIAHLGDPAAGEQLIEPLRALEGIVLDTVAPMPVTGAGAICMDPEDPGASQIDHRLLADLPSDAIDVLVAAVGPDAPDVYFGEIRLLGGQLSVAPPDGSPLGNREAGFLLTALTPIFSRPPTAADRDVARVSHAALLDGIGPWATEGRLFNWLEAGTTEDDVRAAFAPDAWDRLRQIKARVDPDDRLRYNSNIPPVGS